MFKKQFLKIALFLTAVFLHGQTVNPSGAFVYNYPIQVPPAAGGLTPSVALSYNSQGGNGILGKGFNLTGFETLSRDNTYPLNFDDSDHFLLNGQRLIPQEGIPGEYFLENHDFSRVERFGDYWIVTDKRGTKKYYGSSSGNIPVFSSHGDERAGRTRLWALDKVEDIHGNFYEIHYVTFKGAYYPEKIVYSQHNTTVLPGKAVFFNYQKKSHTYTTLNPSEITDEYLLKWVSVTANKALLRKYEMNYTITEFYTQLTSITEYGNKGAFPLLWDEAFTAGSEAKKKPVVFSWSDPSMGNFTSSLWSKEENHNYNHTGDFDGDGKTDFLNWKSGEGWRVNLSDSTKFLSKGVWSGAGNWSQRQFFKDFNGDGKTDFAQQYGKDVWYVSSSTGNTFDTPHMWHAEDFGYSSFTGDFDGDERSDFLNNYNKWGWTVLLAQEDSFSRSRWTTSGYWDNHLIGDYNGDSKDDFICYAAEGWRNHLSTGAEFTTQSGSEAWTISSPGDRNHTGDFNGDGYKDFVQFYGSSARVQLSNGHSRFYDTVWYTGLSDDDRKYISVMDINGDGKDDLVKLKPASRKAETKYRLKIDDNGKVYNEPYSVYSTVYSRALYYLSTGSAFKLFSSTENVSTPSLGHKNHIPGDFNGDGKIDILRWGFHVYDSSFWYVLENNTENHRITSIVTPSGIIYTPEYTPAPLHEGAIISDDKKYPIIATKSPRELVTALTMHDGFNTPLTTKWQYYNGKRVAGTLQERKNLGFEWIKTTKPDGTVIKTTYWQTKNLYPNRGEITPGNMNSVIYALPWAGAVKKTEIFSPGETELLKSSEMYYSSEILQPKSTEFKEVRFIMKTSESITEYSGLNTGTRQINYTYDSSGNVTETLNHGDIAIKGDEIHLKTEYASNPVKNITVPVKIETYSYMLNSDFSLALDTPENLSSKTEFYYDDLTYGQISDKGNLTKKISYSGQTDQENYPDITENYEYDDYGNLTGNTIGSSRTELVYDSYKTLLTETKAVVDPLNRQKDNVSSVLYNEYLQKSQETDINGNITIYTYDDFGRKTEVFQNGALITSTTFSDTKAPDDFPLWIKTQTLSSETGGINNYIFSIVYTDAAGKEIQTRTEFIDETDSKKWAVTNYKRDIVNRTEKVSEPFSSFLGEAFNKEEWNLSHRETVVEKDNISRIISVYTPDGIYAYTHYGNNEVLNITSDGKNIFCTLDKKEGLSLINKTYMEVPFISSDRKNTIDHFSQNLKDSWEYKITTNKAADGEKINEIIFSDDDGIRTGNTLEVRTDFLGRKKNYDDMDKGLWTYTYNTTGNLKKQTDANGNIIEFEYDSLSRVKKKKVNTTDSVTEYFYDGNPVFPGDTTDYGPASKGQLTHLKRGSYSESYFYDDVNRNYRVTKTINGKSRTYETTLNTNGSLKEEILPSGEQVNYSYNEAGALTAMIGDGVSATGFKYDIFGKIREYALGNNTHTTYSYNGCNYLSNILITGATDTIADMTFQYNSLGEITEKTFSDGYYSYSENYTYDGLGRLINATSNGLYNDKTYKYDGYNNIIEKEGKIYNYNSAAPHAHAVTSVESTDRAQVLKKFTYDANGNMIKETGLSSIIISAKGSGTTIPKMLLSFNGKTKEEMTWIITNTETKDFTWHGYIPDDGSGLSTVDVIFPNSDGVNSLTIESIKINGVLLTTDSTNAVFEPETTTATTVNPHLTVSGKMRYHLNSLAAEAMTERTFIYDGENRLTAVKNRTDNIASFGYDDNGQRIYKREGNRITYYFFPGHEETYTYDEGGVLSTDPAEIVSYYFAESIRVAQKSVNTGVNAGTEILYYHSDHLGSAVRLTNEAGEVVQSIAYDPFGKVVYEQRKSDGSSVSRKYTGQEADESTGLYYYNARYYDPDLGRFIQADIMLDGMNRYTYCKNNPIRFTDPTGNSAQDQRGLAEHYARYSQKESEDSALKSIEKAFSSNPVPTSQRVYRIQNATYGPIEFSLLADVTNTTWIGPTYYDMIIYNLVYDDYDSESFAPGSEFKQDYMNYEVHMRLIDGSFLTYTHSGIDRSRGREVVSPGYYRVHSIDGDKIILNRIGTDRYTRIQHINPAELASYKKGDVFSPGQKISNFPKKVYGSASSGPHIHIEESTLNKNGVRMFINPDTHDNPQPWNKFSGFYTVGMDRFPTTYKPLGPDIQFTFYSWAGIAPRPWRI